MTGSLICIGDDCIIDDNISDDWIIDRIMDHPPSATPIVTAPPVTAPPAIPPPFAPLPPRAQLVSPHTYAPKKHKRTEVMTVTAGRPGGPGRGSGRTGESGSRVRAVRPSPTARCPATVPGPVTVTVARVTRKLTRRLAASPRGQQSVPVTRPVTT